MFLLQSVVITQKRKKFFFRDDLVSTHKFILGHFSFNLFWRYVPKREGFIDDLVSTTQDEPPGCGPGVTGFESRSSHFVDL